MGCGRGVTWDVSAGRLIVLDRKHFPDIRLLAAHIYKRANQGYSDAIVALMEASDDIFLQEVISEAKIKWKRK